ncbi:Menaquinone reductase, iron-sulfur cluster-binding subunit [Ferriphaselus amnicola]|uniref:Menaquinone reductase, iron-sulfur cluster-binding subunit n=1 Tax=Ferriphaselus amnicola TaxID=1188319 RepID=A0A2Z6G8M8_9PROT|nr:4Fe-4S dicluster domain-containing protein [Ferriphaselus amnicola]BBE49831.1 Menaquinone reductase, iron-sulfur cluster-binding subunit [Ferriphaselus amnicola]
MSEENNVKMEDAAELDAGRRDFLKFVCTSSAAALVVAPEAAEAVVKAADSADADTTVAEFFQGHFVLMSDEEKKQAIARLEKRYTAKFGKETTVSDVAAPDDVLFGYALDMSKCIGCRRCVHACVEENNQSREGTVIQWIQVMKIPKGNISFSADELEKGYPEKSQFGDYGVQVGGNAYHPAGMTTEGAQSYYQDETVPDKDFFYMPVQCQQCEKPPCVKACPVRATFRDHAGVVLIDYNWCIGCRMCQLACPYQARRFNWGEPQLPAEEMNPKTHYFGNRPRMKGVMEKCTFCVQRTREGRNPACLEACPVGARKFGNLLDPESDVRKVLETKRVFRFKEEFGTYPKFFYYIG